MTLDVSVMSTGNELDPAKLKQKSFVSCNCSVYLKDLWCEHVLAHAMVNGIVKKFPPRFQPKRIGPAANGRIANASRGGCLGYN